MIGILVVAHCELARELINAARMITGDTKKVEGISMNMQEDAQGLVNKIKKSLSRINEGSGVLILTDMFGGTPSNISLSFLEEKKVEIVTGVNLPMLIKVIRERENNTLAKLTEMANKQGRDSISQPGQILRG